MLLKIGKGFNNHNEILLFVSFHLIDCLSELELVAADSFLHEGSPVAVVDLLQLEFPLDVIAAALNIFLVSRELHADDLKIRCGQLNQLLVFGVIGELTEERRKLEEIRSFLEEFIKCFHVMIGLLADDEEGDEMVGVNVVEVEDIGGDILEDEHDVVALV